MLVKVTEYHIHRAKAFMIGTRAWRSPLHFALADIGVKAIHLQYDQDNLDRVIVVTLNKDGINHKLSWLASVAGKAGSASPQDYLLKWDLTGRAVPVEFEYIT